MKLALLLEIAKGALRYQGNQKAWTGAAVTMLSVAGALTAGGAMPGPEEIGSALAVIGAGASSYASIWFKANRPAPGRSRKKAAAGTA